MSPIIKTGQRTKRNSITPSTHSCHFRVLTPILHFLSSFILVIKKLFIDTQLQASLKAMSDCHDVLPSSPSYSVVYTTMIEAMKSMMRDLFNIQPNHFQQHIIPHILMMMKGTIPAQPMLLVQSTGGGMRLYKGWCYHCVGKHICSWC